MTAHTKYDIVSYLKYWHIPNLNVYTWEIRISQPVLSTEPDHTCKSDCRSRQSKAISPRSIAINNGIIYHYWYCLRTNYRSTVALYSTGWVFITGKQTGVTPWYKPKLYWQRMCQYPKKSSAVLASGTRKLQHNCMDSHSLLLKAR